MYTTILDIIGKIAYLSFTALLFYGCANKDVAREAFLDKEYKKSYEIWQRWAKIGSPEAKYKLAKYYKNALIKTKNSNEKIIQNALYAYNHNYKPKKAALILEEAYYNDHKYNKALYWMEKSDLSISTQKQFFIHLYLIKNLIKEYKKALFYINKIQQIAKYGNANASYALGRFFEDEKSIYYNPKKSAYYYNLAYKKGITQAGIRLGKIYFYKLNKKREGLELLRKLSLEDNGATAYEIGNILLQKMYKILDRYNTPCIAYNFNTPKEFFVKKYTLFALKREYLKKNVIPWYRLSYKRGYVNGILKIIDIDIDEDNYHKSKRYSNMDINQTEGFLTSLGDKVFKSQMILAKLYERYPELKKEYIAENIYEKYVDYNKTDAYWHLYQYYKRFNNIKKDKYLKILLKENFLKAMIEEAYFETLKRENVYQNIKFLKKYSDKNIIALRYLASIYEKNIIPNTKQKGCELLKKICRLEHGLNSQTDLKIARCILSKSRTFSHIKKAATIYKFYSDQNNSYATYNLSKIYKLLQDDYKFRKYITKAKNLGNLQAKLIYNKLVLEDKIPGDIKKALKEIEIAAKRGDLGSIILLGDLYAQGVYKPFDPKKAIYYYKKAIKYGYLNGYRKIISLYKLLDVAGNRYHDIISAYKKAIMHCVPNAKIDLAYFYYNLSQPNKALKVTKTIKNKNRPKVRYLLYLLTKNERYLDIGKDRETNYGPILLEKAKRLEQVDRKKALLYAFRASRCNTKNSISEIYKIMKMINNSEIIRAIYNRALKYRRCKNN